MKPPPRKLRLDITELESAFEFATASEPFSGEETFLSFLNLTTGEVASPEDDEMLGDENQLVLPGDLFEDLRYGELDGFVSSLPKDHPLRGNLMRAISGKGAFRRFKDIVFGDVELKHRWHWFQTRNRRECIVEWLGAHNIEPEWDHDIFQAPPLPNKRGDLLRAVLAFVLAARAIPGVRRIALLGSLTTSKAAPKDLDLLVEVSDGMPLAELARLSRGVLGQAMRTGDSCGADVFLCDPRGGYLGRTCPWKTCAPGIRRACQAQNCGERPHLYDDLQIVRLDPALVVEPPLEMWPAVLARADLPEDVREILLAPL